MTPVHPTPKPQPDGGEPAGRSKMRDDFTADEHYIAEAVLNARMVQDFIFGDRSEEDRYFDPEFWRGLFQKRVDTIAAVDPANPSAAVELRKRLLQQAALSIRALVVLNSGAVIVQSRPTENEQPSPIEPAGG